MPTGLSRASLYLLSAMGIPMIGGSGYYLWTTGVFSGGINSISIGLYIGGVFALSGTCLLLFTVFQCVFRQPPLLPLPQISPFMINGKPVVVLPSLNMRILSRSGEDDRRVPEVSFLVGAEVHMH